MRDSLLANKPYDQIVRELLAATGTIADNPPVAWYKRVKEPQQQLEDVAQLFLGVRMQCAQCHHHPFETLEPGRLLRPRRRSSAGWDGSRPATRGEDVIFHKRGMAQLDEQEDEAAGEARGPGRAAPWRSPRTRTRA